MSGAGVTSTGVAFLTTTGATNQNGGNVSIVATNAVNLGGSITTTGGTAATGVGRNAGNVAISGAGITATTILANGSNGTPWPGAMAAMSMSAI